MYPSTPVDSHLYASLLPNALVITVTLSAIKNDEYYEAFVKIYNNYDKMKDVYKENDKELLSRFDYKELAKQLEDVIEENASDIEVVKTLGCD